MDPKIVEILNHSPFAWWEWNLETNRVEFSDLKATMLGYEADSLRNRGYQAFTELVHREDLGRTMDAMTEVIHGPANLYQVDYRIRGLDGVFRWYMDRGYVLDRAPSGRPNRIRGIVIDLGREGETTGNPEAVVEIVRRSFYPTTDGGESVLILCSACHRVKRDQSNYEVISAELQALLGTKISHGICPDCFSRLYPDFTRKHT